MLHFFKLSRRFYVVLTSIYLGCILLAPPILAQQVNLANLRNTINNPYLSAANTGVHVMSLKTGQTILNSNQNVPLIPASNMKVVISAAALTLLKPEYQFKTTVHGSGGINRGILEGDLYIKGHGDPDLTDEQLQAMVEEIKYMGVEKVTGSVIVDDTFFDQEQAGRGWKSDYGSASYSARISALSLNRNTVKVWVRPTQPGQMSTVTLQPESRFFDVVNKAVTTNGATRLKIVRNLTQTGRNQIVITGTVSRRARPEAEVINLDNPSLYAGSVFAFLLQKEGVSFNGQIRKGKTPEGAYQLAMNQSRPLTDIVAELNKNSVNLIAENLLKFLGATFEGEPGSAVKGAKVIQEKFLREQVGVTDQGGIVIADGSGLSPLNRITPELLTKILAYMHERYDLSVDYVSSMAVGGVDGTLKSRFNTPALKRRIRAKTGFINNVSALSGYIFTDSQEVLVFSMLMNHYRNFGAARTVQDNLCSQLVHWK